MTRPLPQGKASVMAEAGVGSIVDRYAPRALIPYLRLARVDRPIGFFLLAFPCLWSVSLASRSLDDAYPDPDPWLLLLFAIGAIVMRAAGCTYNDIVDREIDAEVARTRGRPLPSGQVTPKAALIFMVVLSLIGFAVLLMRPGRISNAVAVPLSPRRRCARAASSAISMAAIVRGPINSIRSEPAPIWWC